MSLDDTGPSDVFITNNKITGSKMWTLESGFLIGAYTGISAGGQVTISFDGTPAQLATGTSTWKIKLPLGAATWKLGSAHYAVLRGFDTSGKLAASRRVDFYKGRNKDFNGDGFPDLPVTAGKSDVNAVDEGAIYIYNGSADGLSIDDHGRNYAQRLLYPGADATPGFGNTVPYLGDINADGYGDLATGAWSSDLPGTGRGVLYIYFGSATGLTKGTGDLANTDGSNGKNYDQRIQYSGTDNNAYLGYFVISAGDINGDGFDDMAASAAYSDIAGLNRGAVFIYFGSANGLTGGTGDVANTDGASGKNYDQRLLYPDVDDSSRFGDQVASAGDVNGDGYADLIIQSTLSDITGVNDGAAFIYFGSVNGLTNGTGDIADTDASNGKNYDQRLLYPDGDTGARFGYVNSTAVDFNNDSYSDIVVGSALSDVAGLDRGAVYVYFGSSTGAGGGTGDMANTDGTNGQNYSQRLLYPDTDDSANFGAVFSYGQFNGDNYMDIAIGAAKSDVPGGTDRGVIYTYLGSSLGLSNGTGNVADSDGTNGKTYDKRFQYAGTDDTAYFGYIFCANTDFNGDGNSDLLVGIWNSDIDGIDNGKLNIYYSTANGLDPGQDEKQADKSISYPESDDGAWFGRFLPW